MNVNEVAVVKSTMVAALPDTAICPVVPKVKDLVLLLLELNICAVSVKLLRSNVPAVSVKVRVDPKVRAPANWVVALLFTVTGKSRVRPLVVMVCVPEVAIKLMAVVPAVSVPPDAGTVRLP